MNLMRPIPGSAPRAMGLAAASALDVDLVARLLEHLPDAPFFVKDRALTYVSANQAMAKLCGVRDATALIGKTAADFFPVADTSYFEALDRIVLNGKAVNDQLRLCRSFEGAPGWLLFSKQPVTDSSGAVIGVAAIARSLPAPSRKHPTYARLSAAMEFINANIGRQIRVSDLARRANISVSQFERDFAALFGVSPNRYITNARLEAAFAMLQSGGDIADIAQACGYCDQSAFTRRFRQTIGASPSEFRRLMRL